MRALLLAHPAGAVDRLQTVIEREEGQNDLIVLIGPFGDDIDRILETAARDGALVTAVPAPSDSQETMQRLAQERSMLHGKTISMDGIDIIGIGSIDGPRMDVEETVTDGEEAALKEIAGAMLERTDADRKIVVTYRNPKEFGADTSETITRLRQVDGVVCTVSGQAVRQDAAELDGCQVINPGDLREGEYAVLETDAMTAELVTL